MTQRDKKLLIVLVVILILFIPNFFITKNVIKDMSTLNKSISELRVQEEEYKLRKNMMPTIKNILADFEEEYNTKKPNTEELVKTYEVHYLLTQLARNNSLVLTSLTIDDPSEVETPDFAVSYFNSFPQTKQVGITEEQILNNKESRVKLQKQTMTFTVSGSINNIISFISSVNNHSNYITIKSVSIPEMDIKTTLSASIGIDIYVIISE